MSIALPPYRWLLYSISNTTGSSPGQRGPGVLPFHYKTRRFRGLLVVLFPAQLASSSSLHCIADQETWSTIVCMRAGRTAFSLLSRVKIKRKKNLTIKCNGINKVDRKRGHKCQIIIMTYKTD